MFQLLAVGHASDEPIQTLLPAKELFTFLLVVQDKQAIWNLWLPEKFALLELAARFECKSITVNIKRLLEYHYAKSRAIDLLIEASNLNSIPIATIAIAKMYRERPSPDWKLWMKYLRPTWQTELKRLLWVVQPVDQSNRTKKRKLNSRPVAQKPERTNMSYIQIAAEFNPASEVSHELD